MAGYFHEAFSSMRRAASLDSMRVKMAPSLDDMQIKWRQMFVWLLILSAIISKFLAYLERTMLHANQGIKLYGNIIKCAILQHVRTVSLKLVSIFFSLSKMVSSAKNLDEHKFTTVQDILKYKGKNDNGDWLWCTTDYRVYDAVRSMTEHNVSAMVVVKPGEERTITGVICERDYQTEVIDKGRSSRSTTVGDIMTSKNKLIVVTPDTTITEIKRRITADNRIERIIVSDGKWMIGMISLDDVSRAMVCEHVMRG